MEHFLPNKPAFTQNVLFLPSTFLFIFLKLLNSANVNFLMCKVCFEVNAATTVQYETAEKLNICSNYLDEGSWGEGILSTQTSPLHCCCVREHRRKIFVLWYYIRFNGTFLSFQIHWSEKLQIFQCLRTTGTFLLPFCCRLSSLY